MVDMFPNNIWLSTVILFGIVVATAAVAAFSTLRWSWKALPLVLGAAFAIPFLINGVLLMAIPLVADRVGITGYFVHTTTLFLIGISSALLGSGFAMMLLLVRSRAR